MFHTKQAFKAGFVSEILSKYRQRKRNNFTIRYNKNFSARVRSQSQWLFNIIVTCLAIWRSKKSLTFDYILIFQVQAEAESRTGQRQTNIKLSLNTKSCQRAVSG